MFAREFKRYKGEGSIPTVEFNYVLKNSPIEKIVIRKKDQQSDRYRDCLDIQCVNTREGIEFSELIGYATELVHVFEESSVEQKALRKRSSYEFYTKYTSVAHLKKLVDILHYENLINKNICNQLLADIDFKVLSNDVHADILAQAKMDVEKAKELALQYDKEYGYRGVIWHLAEYFKQNDLLKHAAEMYQAIPKNNQYYAQACTELKLLLQRQLTAHQMGTVKLTPEKIQTIKEQMLELCLLAEDAEQASLIFNDLSGYDLSLALPQIKLNNNSPETFIALARQAAKLNHKNEILQLELQQLKKNFQEHSNTEEDKSHHSIDQEVETKSTFSSVLEQSSSTVTPSSLSITPSISFYASTSSAMYAQRGNDRASLENKDIAVQNRI